ncbi:hypothetical protein ACFP81_12345 [Deinococcus lacus]|uniref:Cellulose synthase operon C C-terminal domain-containing protein n=1 Tax=Deinococcus lacus TaxID=392561 RepID=A0ABW1YGN2_9DEIO
MLATAEVAGQRAGERSNRLSVRYQSEGYTGLGRGSAGLTARGRYDVALSGNLGARVEGEYNTLAVSQQGYLEAQALYKQAPLTFGLGGRSSFGDRQGLSVTGSVGYRDRTVGAEIKHAQPVSGDVQPVTEFGVDYRLAENVTLTAKDRYTWGTGHLASVALNNRVGATNYLLAYEVSDTGLQDNRARLGVSTALPLNDRTSLGIRGAYVYSVTSGTHDLSASADLSYRGDGYRATLGTDLKYAGGLSSVVRAGVAGSLNEHLSLSADGTAEFGARSGGKLGLGYAYRNNPLSSLGYLRYASGSLSSRDELTAGVAAEYRQPSFGLRGGLDARMLLEDSGTLTYQPYFGADAYVMERFKVGGWGRALVQPATDTLLYGYGVEAGYEVLDSTWLTLGYNLAGFDGLDVAGLYTRPGLYVRLDLTLDDTLNGEEQ